MTNSVNAREKASAIDGCVVEFLDTQGISGAAYTCGKCAVIAARGSDGLTYTDEGECEKLLFDAPDREYSDAPSH